MGCVPGVRQRRTVATLPVSLARVYARSQAMIRSSWLALLSPDASKNALTGVPLDPRDAAAFGLLQLS